MPLAEANQTDCFSSYVLAQTNQTLKSFEKKQAEKINKFLPVQHKIKACCLYNHLLSIL